MEMNVKFQNALENVPNRRLKKREKLHVLTAYILKLKID